MLCSACNAILTHYCDMCKANFTDRKFASHHKQPHHLSISTLREALANLCQICIHAYSVPGSLEPDLSEVTDSALQPCTSYFIFKDDNDSPWNNMYSSFRLVLGNPKIHYFNKSISLIAAEGKCCR